MKWDKIPKTKKKIGINLLYMNRKLTGGSIIYGINLVNAISKLDNYNNYTIYVNKDCRDLPIKIGSNFKIKVIPFNNKYVYVRYFWEQIIFPFILVWNKLDVLHSLGYVGPLFCPSKHIVSILDLNYKRHANSMSLTKRVLLGSMVRLMSYFSTKILTISNFSKNEICGVLNVSEDKVIVTHLSGSNDRYLDSESNIDLKNLYNIHFDYIIAFGSPSSHKNILGLISAFSELLKSKTDIILVLVGHQHSGKDLNELLLSLNLVNKVVFTGFVPDEHVFPLIGKSKLFVFPSFYEGFGIPLLDAQSLGVPVASSNAASLPEVGGDGAKYFDPNNIGEISDVLKNILENITVSKELTEKGLINRTNYSWSKTAEKTLECYNLVSI
jgi:glycosyltransferase involved in cell wall biosynthesis